MVKFCTYSNSFLLSMEAYLIHDHRKFLYVKIIKWMINSSMLYLLQSTRLFINNLLNGMCKNEVFQNHKFAHTLFTINVAYCINMCFNIKTISWADYYTFITSCRLLLCTETAAMPWQVFVNRKIAFFRGNTSANYIRNVLSLCLKFL